MKNNNFCYAPWMHLYTNPDGRLMPCCMFHDNNNEFPDLNLVPIEAAINHPKMIKLRQELMVGETPAGCFRCDAQAKMNMTPYRTKMNNYGEKQNIKFNQDGTVNPLEFKPSYLDIRFGNLCNLKCRTCSPTFSSSIAVEFNKMNNVNFPVLHSLNIGVIDQILSNLDNVEHIYLAGGEPLIEENNYILIKKLIERNLKPSLLYNTNLTNIKYKDNKLTELWEHFPDVKLTVSLDGYKEVNNYVRFGSNYDQILENIMTIKREAPHVTFNINSVASIMSIHSLPELGRDILQRGICGPEEMVFSICHHPEIFDPVVLPAKNKEEVLKLFDEYKNWIKDNFGHTIRHDFLIKKCIGLMDHMMSCDNSGLLPEALIQLGNQDRFRKTDYRTICNFDL